MDDNFDKDAFIRDVQRAAMMQYGRTFDHCNIHEQQFALSKVVMQWIAPKWEKTSRTYARHKQAVYLSAEYLLGRALGNNLLNLRRYQAVRDALLELGVHLNQLEEAEEDAGLGNGGLGRLAACFLDSAASHNLPLTGYGIRYDYGIFKQKFMDSRQVECVDDWQRHGDPWSIRRDDDAVVVRFADLSVRAVPYDMPVIGFDTANVNTLRLWKAEPVRPFDLARFNDQDYEAALIEKNRAEDISRILYPNDSKNEGKILRLRQQYFFVSASLRDIIRRFRPRVRTRKDWRQLPDFFSIQLNDTHPAVAIPELMRLLLAEGLTWNTAWRIVRQSFAYTNHTILAEALEQWWTGFFKQLLPDIFDIIRRLDKQLVEDLRKKNYSAAKIRAMRIISKDMIRMAWLAIYGSHTVNGVARLHTELLKHQELKDWHQLYPAKFQNKTNGITQRRWLGLANPELSALITDLLGHERWTKDLSALRRLARYADDESVLAEFARIKRLKKQQLAAHIAAHEGIRIDPDSLFDVQVKRLHEYKRQLLNAFHILDLYYRILDQPRKDYVPRTFIFGAKAAPGYRRAKAIIRFINDIARLVNKDTRTAHLIKIVFVQNYRVSYAEKIFPAADLSEQISTAGKEASGTGNMKFMLNGTPTIGTWDGANIEIAEAAGPENNFLFGLTVEDIKALKPHYDPAAYYRKVPGLQRVVDALIDNRFGYRGDSEMRELYDALLKGADWHAPDHYFVLADFDAYRQKQIEVNAAYLQKDAWLRKCWLNMCHAGRFSSDRTIKAYATDIWHIKAHKIRW